MRAFIGGCAAGAVLAAGFCAQFGAMWVAGSCALIGLGCAIGTAFWGASKETEES